MKKASNFPGLSYKKSVWRARAQEQFQVFHYLLEPGEVDGPGKMLRNQSGLGEWRQTSARSTNRAGMLGTRDFLNPGSSWV